jgi:aspartate aminotransferase-like enzyme
MTSHSIQQFESHPEDNDCHHFLSTVTSMGGIPLYIDDWKIDAAYAGSQKCLIG